MPRTPAVITLEDPIEAHGDTINELTLRPPNGNDLVACGVPFSMGSGGGGGAAGLDASVTSDLISRLAGIPRSSVGALGAADWMACMRAIMDFIGPSGGWAPEPRQSSPDTSTSPGSGNPIPAGSSA
jgi:hypothetical protein